MKLRTLIKIMTGVAIFLALLLSPIWWAMFKNQIKINAFSNQFDAFEEKLGLQGLLKQANKTITLDYGSGNYCLFVAERTYAVLADDKLKNKIMAYEFKNVDIPDDGEGPKITLSQNGPDLTVEIMDGPWDNFFDPRCG